MALDGADGSRLCDPASDGSVTARAQAAADPDLPGSRLGAAAPLATACANIRRVLITVAVAYTAWGVRARLLLALRARSA